MTPHLLMIEDDAGLAEMVATYLGEAGLQVTLCADGARGLAELEQDRYDGVILDVMLGNAELDGFEVLRRLRRRHEIPVLMLTARGEATDRIVGLEMGADDYLPKPFDPRELLARLRAILRRRNRESTEARPTLCFGRLEIDAEAREARLDEQIRPLTGYQFDLLWELASHAGRVMSRDDLMNAVRGVGHEAFDRSIDVHISRIRSAIEDDPRRPRRILTLRGAGYLFAKRQAP